MSQAHRTGFVFDRRRFLASLGAAGTATALPALTAGADDAVAAASRPRPSPSQLAWQREELSLFVHFGVNTFTDREWGTGEEDPKLFAPAALDARQWAQVAKDAGFRSDRGAGSQRGQGRCRSRHAQRSQETTTVEGEPDAVGMIHGRPPALWMDAGALRCLPGICKLQCALSDDSNAPVR